MRLTNNSTNWGAVAKAFHWIIALGILVNIGLGLWAHGLPLSPRKLEAFYWHKSVGLTLLWLVVLRVLWRFTNPAPRLPTSMPRWERIGAHASHLLLYLLMLALPLSGWVINSAANFPLDLYGVLPVPDLVPKGPNEAFIEDVAKAVHYWIFVAMSVLLTLHVLAALKHHVIDRDHVLRRMLPFSRASDPIRGG